MRERMYYRDYECRRDSTPSTKVGQTIDVSKGKKKFKVKITQPNYRGSNVAEGMANGKKYTCWFNHNCWTTSER